MATRTLFVVFSVLALTGCNIPGLTPEETGPRLMAEADGKATGSACRHALRGVEDCYALNPLASRAAVFAGWKEMDLYMRDNKIDGMVPTLSHGASTVEADEPVAAATPDRPRTLAQKPGKLSAH